MLKPIATYIAVAVPFVALDAIWLWLMGQLLYKPTLGDIIRAQPNIWPAVVFYLLYPAGLVVFAVWPALEDGKMSQALLMGVLFGFFSYATYDLTNHATLRNWTITLTAVDMAWGSMLAATSATAAYFIVQRIFAS